MAMSMESKSLSMELIPIDSIESPTFPKNLTLEERHRKLAQLSIARAMGLGAMSSSPLLGDDSTMSIDQKINNIDLQPSMQRMFNNYVVRPTVGTKLYQPYLALEFSQGDIWMQCDSCKLCLRLLGGNFKPEQSTSFRYLKCNHTLCVPNTCDDQKVNCMYKGGFPLANSSGFMGTDTFHFPSGNPSAPIRTFRDLAFGCGIYNTLQFPNPDNTIAGVLSLGNGKRSFLTQIGQTRFSYCLPPLGSSTILHFGDEARITRPNAQTTTFIQGQSRYYLKVSGISVQETLLQINPTLFVINPITRFGGFLIDIGSPYTVLLQGIYDVVKNAIINHFRAYGLNHVPRLVPPYEVCYRRSGGNVVRPNMTIHFEGGANLRLDHTVIFNDFQAGFCMIILPNQPPTGANMLGAFQQKGHRFVYDTIASTISFVPENCVNN